MSEVLDNLDVQYTYHVHEGSEGTTANGCYVKASFHSHVRKYCSPQVYCNQGPESNTNPDTGSIVYKYYGFCSNCGRKMYHNGSIAYEPCASCYTCGKSTSSIESYGIGCGKTEETIESVTIKY